MVRPVQQQVRQDGHPFVVVKELGRVAVAFHHARQRVPRLALHAVSEHPRRRHTVLHQRHEHFCKALFVHAGRSPVVVPRQRIEGSQNQFGGVPVIFLRLRGDDQVRHLHERGRVERFQERRLPRQVR